MAQTQTYDFAVIGAGIAGASVAARLADGASVLLLEMESQPGYHTTGRSAAMFAPGYGPPQIRALTRASTRFFETPPEGFADVPLLSRRDVVMIGRADQAASLDAMMEELGGEADISRIDADAVQRLRPLLKPGYAAGGVLDSSGSDIDVNALHQGFLRQFRKLGGTLQTGAEVTGFAARWRCMDNLHRVGQPSGENRHQRGRGLGRSAWAKWLGPNRSGWSPNGARRC